MLWVVRSVQLKVSMMTVFVDILSGINADGGAESEGRTFADALARAILSVEVLAEGVIDTSQWPTFYSSFFIIH